MWHPVSKRFPMGPWLMGPRFIHVGSVLQAPIWCMVYNGHITIPHQGSIPTMVWIAECVFRYPHDYDSVDRLILGTALLRGTLHYAKRFAPQMAMLFLTTSTTRLLLRARSES